MQTYLSLRNDACVYVYMSAYADICLHMQTSHADLCMSGWEIILLRLARHTPDYIWPEPGPRTERKLDPTSPIGEVEVSVLEEERRKNHTDMIRLVHPLLSIANHCLHYQ